MPIEKGCTHCGSDQHNTTEFPMRDAAPAGERETIRAVFLRNGFTVKEGHTDLKPYVYAAAEELLSIARASWQRAQSAPAGAVPGGWRLVPVEPTPEMLQAGADEPLAGDHDDDAPEDYRAVFKAMLAAAPQPAPQHGDKVCQHIEEAAGILRNMIDSIATRGNYSQESTLLFLNQALGSIDAAISAQGEGART